MFQQHKLIQNWWYAPAWVEVFTPTWFLGLFMLQINSVCLINHQNTIGLFIKHYKNWPDVSFNHILYPGNQVIQINSSCLFNFS